MKHEFWQQPDLWPKDLTEKNIFLLEALSTLGKTIYPDDWSEIPGFFVAKGKPLPIEVARASTVELSRADYILRFSRPNYQPRSRALVAADSFETVMCPVLTDGDLFLASIALGDGVYQSSEQSKMFIVTAQKIAAAIANGSLICRAQMRPETQFVDVGCDKWNLDTDEFLPRFAFGEAKLSSPRSKEPRGPDRLYIDRKSFNDFLSQSSRKSIGDLENYLKGCMEGDRTPMTVKKAVMASIPSEYAHFSRTTKNAAYKIVKLTLPLKSRQGGRPKTHQSLGSVDKVPYP